MDVGPDEDAARSRAAWLPDGGLAGPPPAPGPPRPVTTVARRGVHRPGAVELVLRMLGALAAWLVGVWLIGLAAAFVGYPGEPLGRV